MQFNQQHQQVEKQTYVEGNYIEHTHTDNTKVLAEAKIKRYRGEIQKLEYDQEESIEPPISSGMRNFLFVLDFIVFLVLAVNGIISPAYVGLLFFISLGMIWLGVTVYNSQEMKRKQAIYEQKIKQLTEDIAKQKEILEQPDNTPVFVQPPIKNREGKTPEEVISTIKILFLAANPSDKTRLRLDKDSRSIDEALRKANFGSQFELKQHWAVRVSDIQGFLLRYRPDIVYFCGHGSKNSEIFLEDDAGKSYPVPVEALSQLFSIFKNNIKCVILNACYSEKQAKAIAQHIDCVIGMSNEIKDTTGIIFASAFFQALGNGSNVQDAFELGRNQIILEGINEQDIPKLIATKCDPEDVVFVHKNDT